jgi:hypothetical protein
MLPHSAQVICWSLIGTLSWGRADMGADAL